MFRHSSLAVTVSLLVNFGGLSTSFIPLMSSFRLPVVVEAFSMAPVSASRRLLPLKQNEVPLTIATTASTAINLSISIRNEMIPSTYTCYKSYGCLYASTSSPEQEQGPASLSLLPSSPEAISSFLKETAQPLFIFIMHSFLLALLYIGWETYACSHLLPSRTILVNSLSASSPSASYYSTIRGMGFGKHERLALLKQQQQLQQDDEGFISGTITTSSSGSTSSGSMSSSEKESNILMSIPSYNEVMEQHREERVARWKDIQSNYDQIKNDDSDKNNNYALIAQRQHEEIDKAVDTIYQSLQVVFELKALSKDYEWDKMHALLKIHDMGDAATAANTFATTTSSNSNPLKSLENAATVLRVSLAQKATPSAISAPNTNKNNIRVDAVAATVASQEIGFDWGSCAWRHCGALADAEEAIDQLDHMIGVLEPFECLFCLDILERSLRDIWAVIPEAYKDEKYSHREYVLPDYQPYTSSSSSPVEEYDQFDADYLRVLEEFRQS